MIKDWQRAALLTVVEAFYRGQHRFQEREALDVRRVTGRRDDMIGSELHRPFVLMDGQMDFIAPGVHASDCPRMGRNEAIHTVLEPSRSGRPECGVSLRKPHAWRKVAECGRCLGPEPGAPSRTQTKVRPPQTAPDVSLCDFLAWIVPINRSARNDRHVGARLT